MNNRKYRKKNRKKNRPSPERWEQQIRKKMNNIKCKQICLHLLPVNLIISLKNSRDTLNN